MYKLYIAILFFFYTDNKRPTTPPAIRFPDLVER